MLPCTSPRSVRLDVDASLDCKAREAYDVYLTTVNLESFSPETISKRYLQKNPFQAGSRVGWLIIEGSPAIPLGQ